MVKLKWSPKKLDLDINDK